MDNTSYLRCIRVLISHCLCFRSCRDHDETAKSTGQGRRHRRLLLRCQGEPHACHPMEEEWQKGVRSVQLSILINVTWNVLSLDSVNRFTSFEVNLWVPFTKLSRATIYRVYNRIGVISFHIAGQKKIVLKNSSNIQFFLMLDFLFSN